MEEFLGIAGLDASTVEDGNMVGDGFIVFFYKQAADMCMHLLGLFDGGRLPCADGPDGLIGDHHLFYIFFRKMKKRLHQLGLHKSRLCAHFADAEGLATAKNWGDAILETEGHLL